MGLARLALLSLLFLGQAILALAWCGTSEFDPIHDDVYRQLLEEEENRLWVPPDQFENLTIDTYFHVITSTDSTEFDDVSFEAQIDNLNDAYAPANISFNLVTINRMQNDTWARDHDPGIMEYTTRQGNVSTLNIYFQERLKDASSVHGYCTLWTLGLLPRKTGIVQYWPDACHVRIDELFDGGGESTTVHEVGHWLGLLHVFQGSTCNPDDYGDYIVDTPPQITGSQTCGFSVDPCSGEVDFAMGHNFMDYSPTACRIRFTPGQYRRMRHYFEKYRSIGGIWD